MKSALAQLVEPFMPTEGVPKRKEYLNSYVETPFHRAQVERQTGMICVEKIGMVRRYYFVEKMSIREICRILKMGRVTVRKIIRSSVTEFKYVRKSQPYPKLEHWRERLEKILEENEALPKKLRRRMNRIWKELVNDGYDGGYASIYRYAKKWRVAHGKQQAQAFIPLIFEPGEAYQFDWSEEKGVMAGELTTVTVAHFKLSHSRMPFSIAYPRETQEMVFDAHDEAFKFFGNCPATPVLLVAAYRQFQHIPSRCPSPGQNLKNHPFSGIKSSTLEGFANSSIIIK